MDSPLLLDVPVPLAAASAAVPIGSEGPVAGEVAEDIAADVAVAAVAEEAVARQSQMCQSRRMGWMEEQVAPLSNVPSVIALGYNTVKMPATSFAYKISSAYTLSSWLVNLPNFY